MSRTRRRLSEWRIKSKLCADLDVPTPCSLAELPNGTSNSSTLIVQAPMFPMTIKDLVQDGADLGCPFVILSHWRRRILGALLFGQPDRGDRIICAIRWITDCIHHS